ncbi:unnamed protein product [Ceratitis capitata]|uniref:(Mediterranean fruit fly) hypothetical protein n=1 Tax=Ceratitis capitata TaxID=7213 RepID=A0A811URA7_CERCA|nr:unnamed protein product [Ceratitis capitata]
MDIDPSIRINAINYANIPNLKYAGKRQTDSNLSNPPMKAQRNFHVSTSPEEAETSFDNKDNTPPITFEQYGVENPDYYPYNYENAYFTDIQFLESTHANQQNGFGNYNFRPPLPPQPQQQFMSYQVAQRPQLHPQRPNIFNRPQYQHGPKQPTGLYQYPQGYHNYNQQQTQRNQHYNPPPRLIAQKPQPKPEPMDIDPSIRINAINYANRPNLKYAGKRQTDSNLSNPPMKAQRNFHVSTSPEEAETSVDIKDNTPPITFEQNGVENPDYYPYNYENAYFTDIQFLE